jgi:hypothetical protein
MRTIKANHTAVSEPIADLVTYRAMPTKAVEMNRLDPFIFLNHHGWQQYKPNNTGLPFGPHPHRGFETVTFILEGDLMTAGSGLVHAEISSDEFKREGGALEILQLWVNLPAKYKMTKPKYVGLQKEEIPTLSWDNGLVTAQIISGVWDGEKAPIEPLTDIHLSIIDFKAGGAHTFHIDNDKTVFLYIVKGEMKINGEPTGMHHLVEFNNDGKIIEMKAITDSVILFGYATPFKEPFVAYGPFVMNTQEEIMQAYEDYNKGKFGDDSL